MFIRAFATELLFTRPDRNSSRDNHQFRAGIPTAYLAKIGL
jgi:hypothetical protein